VSTVEIGIQRAAGARSAAAGRLIDTVAAVLVLAWSWKWLPPMFAMVREQTEIGRGLSGVPSGHAVFELVFVAAHCGVRWLPGVAAIVGAAALTRWWLKRS
jgi:hypothetical protein